MSSDLHKRTRWTGSALIVLLLLIIALAIAFPPADYVPAAQWGAALESAGFKGILAFLVTGILATSVGLPRQLVAFIGGLAYGTLAGLALSLIAALAGCCLTTLVSRRFLAGMVTERFPKAIETLERLVQRDLFLKILVLRLQPLGTNLLTNVCIGFTSASLPRFLAASAVGYIPQMLVFNLLGAGIRVDSRNQLLVSAVMLLVSIAIAGFLYKKHLKTKEITG